MLAVNKTECTIRVRAVCMGEDDCTDLNQSDLVSIPAHSTFLFDDTNVPSSGCDGDFAYFLFQFPPPNDDVLGVTYPTLASMQQCIGNGDCIDLIGPPTITTGYSNPPNNLPEDCIGASGQIRGEYSSAGSAGSFCHMVFDYRD